MQSVFIGSDSELITRILHLHRSGPRVLDVTFGHGRFWGRDDLVGPGQEKYRVLGLDLRMASLDVRAQLARFPQVEGVFAGDYTKLPFKRGSFDVVICDPPFLARGGAGSRMKQRYSVTGTYEDLLLSLERGMDEFVRVLKPKGIVILKMMDLTEGRRRRWSHIDIANLWIPRLRLDDLIIKIAPQSMDSPTWKSQQRSRASHTYFMVFRPVRRYPSNNVSDDRPVAAGHEIA